MESIRSVQFRMGGAFVDGFLQFGIDRGLEKQGGVFNAANKENSVVFYKSENEIAEHIKEYIEYVISSRKKSSLITSNHNNRFSTTDEIMKYKEFLDKGIIFLEEFEAKKKHLINL